MAPDAVPATSVQPSTLRSGTAFKYLLYTHTPAQARAAGLCLSQGWAASKYIAVAICQMLRVLEFVDRRRCWPCHMSASELSPAMSAQHRTNELSDAGKQLDAAQELGAEIKPVRYEEKHGRLRRGGGLHPQGGIGSS